jgi:hypothetical protein
MLLPVPDASGELILEVHLDSREEIAKGGPFRQLNDGWSFAQVFPHEADA